MLVEAVASKSTCANNLEASQRNFQFPNSVPVSQPYVRSWQLEIMSALQKSQTSGRSVKKKNIHIECCTIMNRTALDVVKSVCQSAQFVPHQPKFPADKAMVTPVEIIRM